MPSYVDSTGVTNLTSDIKALADATYPANSAIVNAYSASSAYAVGDFCIHGGLFYKCNTAIASGGETWNSSHWTQTNVTSEWGTKMVVLSYGSSTWSDFIAAFNANAVVYCKASSNSNPGTGTQGRMAFMAYVNYSSSTPTSVEFQYYRSVSSHSVSQQGDQVFIYKLENTNGGKWTVTTREAATKIELGSGLSGSYSSGTYTITNSLVSDVSGLSTAVGNLSDNFAEEYDSTQTYELNSYCIHENVLYKCTTAITTAEAWTAAHWTVTNVVNELSSRQPSAKLTFLNTIIPINNFITDLTYDDFPYRAGVSLLNVTNTMFPTVVFGISDASSGVFAPIAESYDGGIYLYANIIPEGSILGEIDEDMFLTKVSGSGTMTFTYTTDWDMDPEDYGITLSGSPNNGDEIEVVYDTSESTVEMTVSGSVLIPTIVCEET